MLIELLPITIVISRYCNYTEYSDYTLHTSKGFTKDMTYTTAEVCLMFNISKSTLFRWEDKQIVIPDRDPLNNQRIFTEKNIREISQHIQQKLGEELTRAAEEENQDKYRELEEALSLQKVIEGDKAGLVEMKSIPSISVSTIRQLLRIAERRFEAGDERFCAILHVIIQQTCPGDPMETYPWN